MANPTGLLSPCLWLLSLSFASQQQQDSSCTSSGTLPAAKMFLSTISANEGDTVSGRCLIPAGDDVTIVFFCKDGMEISRLEARRGKFSYDLVYRVAGSSGNISCGYMYRKDNNQVLNSLLSIARYLKVTGANSRSSTTKNPPYQALSPSSQEICSAPGALPAPTLYLSPTSAQQGDSVLLQCSVFSQLLATRIVFCKDGEEVSSQRGLEDKITYDYVHVVSMGSSGNYSCGYEIKDSDNRVNGSLLSPAQHLSVTGSASSSGGGEEPTRTGPAMSLSIWAARCALVLLLLVSAPVITFMMEKRGLTQPAQVEETRGRSASILREEAKGDPH
ncbi:uncharacterized protein LOC122172964 [Chrysemys picta bellii]|uniref:uncharacterized protein LOC122172964 n=1 Tax=Chrysemys picta bellii TaxID=8478 RepID=UPI0032B2330E